MVIDTVVCLTLAKWETVSGQFGGYLKWSMYFEIQICNPVIRDCSNEKRETLPSAMRAVFPEAAEDAIMVWNWVPVRINYNCHLSVMMGICY